jgi:hypothetical protein
MSIKRSCCRWGLVLAVLLCGQALPARALAQANPKDRVPEEKPREPQRFSLEEREWRWIGRNGILNWLSEKTELPVITTMKPAGRFCFRAPRGADGNPQRCTIAEIVDLLNEALAQQQMILVRKIASFTLLDSTQPIPLANYPRLTEAELQERGKTEVASIMLRLQTLDAETLIDEVKQLLSPRGKVATLGKANLLVLMDEVGTLRQAVKSIRELDRDGPQRFNSLTHSQGSRCRSDVNHIPGRRPRGSPPQAPGRRPRSHPHALHRRR